ncbi:MAG: putative transposase [Sphingobacteriales bacterium]|nr:putative transposase [Sphingobacteriales bacterium]
MLTHAGINSWQVRVLSALKNCRTAAMGGHVDACTDCGILRISYNSCGNRHCPKCQGKNRERWIANREAELLPVPYFHVVFTLPDTLNQLALHQPKAVYDALFEAAWGTIGTFGNNPRNLGAATGMISILHTWGQQVSLHPHLHCIVPGGGISKQGKWKTAKSKGKYLFPVKAMSKVFRAKYVEALKARINPGKSLIDSLFKKEWVVFAKRPFGNPKSVVEYLGRYTHKIAISNHRIKNIDHKTVSFSYKDYRNGAQKSLTTLDSIEFIRRFSMHILPKGFVRIRHFGILSSNSKKQAIPLIKDQFPKETLVPVGPRILETYNPKLCPHCKTQTMTNLEILPKRGPPSHAQLMEIVRMENNS